MPATTRKAALCLTGGAVALALTTGLSLRSHLSVEAAGVFPTPWRERSPATPANPASGPASATVDLAANEESVIPPLPANATHVPDDYLLRLSSMVNLLNAEERRIDKARWSRAVPIAERLVHGPCDCEQRNWLNHFIAMGHDALEGSEGDYYELAYQMRKMARNDQQLAAHPEFFTR